MHKLPRGLANPASLFRHGGIPPGEGTVLDFSASINPLGPPRSVLRALRRELPAIARYPDPACRDLVQRLAEQHRVEPDQVVVGNGSNELIHAVARTFRPRRVAIAEPTYTEYLRASQLVGADVDHWLAAGEYFDLDPFDPEGADLVWLCNPNNPTGRLWPTGALLPWIEGHRHTLFVVDEAFLSFRVDEAEHSAIPLLERVPNLVVVRSLTKVYALPGLRLGYAVASPARAAHVREQLAPWSVNALAQIAGRAALEDDGFLRQTRAWLPAERETLARWLNGLACDLEVTPSGACFLLLRLRGVTSAWLTRALLRRGIAVRDASNFVGLDDHYVRVAVRLPEENRRLREELGAVLGDGRRTTDNGP